MSSHVIPATTSAAAIERVIKMVRTRARTGSTAMEEARKTMQSEELAMGAASALTTLFTEWESLPKDKRAESPLKSAIRAVYKDMSTAVSHERANLRRELNDDAAETAKLHATFPFRIKSLKGCFVVMTAAEFDAETANRRTASAPVGGTGEDAGEGEGDTGAAGIDKAAAAIAALETALAEMTADRDAWKTRALLAESIAIPAKKRVSVSKPKAQAKASKKAA